ncbi:hypothetical protein ACFLZV_00445 [Candidatus Margulisiibacteriota bacterium]
MKKRAKKIKQLINWRIVFGITMLILGTFTYGIHYVLFRDSHHIFIYLVGDVAFVFFEVLLVTLVIHHLLNQWEKQSHLKKLNMVIETFFSEFGKQLLQTFSKVDKNVGKIRDLMTCNEGCKDFNFDKAFKSLSKYKSDICVDGLDLVKLSQFLTSKREFLINMLQNPSLLEHEKFTETLMSVFHIAEELAARDLEGLSEDDIKHAKVDIERAYDSLIKQWLNYMQYTQQNYPYFFVFAIRTNPFS